MVGTLSGEINSDEKKWGVSPRSCALCLQAKFGRLGQGIGERRRRGWTRDNAKRQQDSIRRRGSCVFRRLGISWSRFAEVAQDVFRLHVMSFVSYSVNGLKDSWCSTHEVDCPTPVKIHLVHTGIGPRLVLPLLALRDIRTPGKRTKYMRWVTIYTKSNYMVLRSPSKLHPSLNKTAS